MMFKYKDLGKEGGRSVFGTNLSVGGYGSRWYVDLVIDCITIRIYVHPHNDSDTMKCLKKTWEHYSKCLRKCEAGEAYALFESEDGEVHDMGQHWAMEPFYYMEEHDIPLPHNIPFI